MFLCTFDIFLYEELKYKIKHKIKFDKNCMLPMCHVLCCKTRIQKRVRFTSFYRAAQSSVGKEFK